MKIHFMLLIMSGEKNCNKSHFTLPVEKKTKCKGSEK